MILIFLVDEFHKEARMAAWGKITTEQAGGFVLGFGKYRGRSVEQVAGTDDGLRYLDYVVGQDWCFPLPPGCDEHGRTLAVTAPAISRGSREPGRFA